MTKSLQIALGYVGIAASMIGIAELPNLGDASKPNAIILASLAMLGVINIVHASDQTFLLRHRMLVAIVVAGIVMPLLYSSGMTIASSADWIYFNPTNISLLIFLMIIVGRYAFWGIYRSIVDVPVPKNTSDAMTSERELR